MRLFHKLAMAIVLVSLLAMLFPISVAMADAIVTIPDSNLKAAIWAQLGRNPPVGDIYKSDLGNLTTLNANGLGIIDLTGLEYCSSLEYLSLYGNQIGNISALSGLTSLTDLYLGKYYGVDPYLDGNQISDVSDLSGLVNLDTLVLDCNQIIDLRPLSGLAGLQWLSANNNQIIYLPSGLASLEVLVIMDNQISDLSPLSGLTIPRWLQLDGNQINNLSPLSGLTGSSITLCLNRNQISDLLPLKGLAGLHWLFANNNQISDLKPLVDNTGLSSGDSLDIRTNPLSIKSIDEYIPQLQTRGVSVTYGGAYPPTQPVNLSPVDGDLRVGLIPTLQSSEFSDPDTGDTHAMSQWQIRTATGNYFSPVYDSGLDYTNLRAMTIPSAPGGGSILIKDTTYYWHVRYQDNNGAWSSWSSETSFTTSNRNPAQPSNDLPTNGAKFVGQTLTLESSSFSDPDPGQTHAASQWQLTTISGDYSSPIYDSETDTTNLTSITIHTNNLNCNTTYYWHVKHQDNQGAWSDNSNETSFTYDGNTLKGSNVSVELIPGYVTVTFAQVNIAGCTVLNINVGPPENWGPIPSGFKSVVGYVSEITTTADIDGPVTGNATYPASLVTNEDALTVLYWDDINTKWVEADNVVVYKENDRIQHQMPFLAPAFLAERVGPALPIVTTNNAANVFASSAILVGYLNSKGTASSVDVSFQWATDDYYTTYSDYGNETSPPWPMTSTGLFGYSLTGLSPDSTYHFRAKAMGAGTAYGNDASFTTAGPGNDSDGVPPTVENKVLEGTPNQGDGNYDGIPDSDQANVASLPNAANGGYATIVSPFGSSLTNVAAVSISSLPSEGKPNLAFPYGLFSFNITGIPSGSTVWVTLRFENAVAAGSQYWKYGPTPDNHAPHWYQIPMSSNDGDNVIQIPLIDGGLGDDDLTANGVIVDQGGPGQPPQPSGPSGTAGVPVFPSVYIGIGAAIGAGVVAYLIRRKVVQGT